MTSVVQQHADVFSRLPANVHRGAVEAYICGASHRGLIDDDLAMLVTPWTGELGQPAFYRQIVQGDERFTDEIEPLCGRLDEPVHIVGGADDI